MLYRALVLPAMHLMPPKLLSRLEAEAPTRAPASEVAVRAAFEALGQSPTADVVALYGCLDGMDEMCNKGWRLWPLSEIEIDRQSGLIMFSDYLIWCWDFQQLQPISLSESRVLSCVGGDTVVEVAPTLAAFLAGLNNDPDGMLHGANATLAQAHCSRRERTSSTPQLVGRGWFQRWIGFWKS